MEELLAKRGITVTYETIRQWCRKFGAEYARKLKRRQGLLGDVWHLDEVFVKIRGKRHYLWRAVDQDGDLIDILVQRSRNASRGRALAHLVCDRLHLCGLVCEDYGLHISSLSVALGEGDDLDSQIHVVITTSISAVDVIRNG